jgi:pilus assembly protein Flp/PilA
MPHAPSTAARTLRCHALASDVRGAGLVEYIVLVGCVALLALAGFRVFGQKVTAKALAQAQCVLTFSCGPGHASGDDGEDGASGAEDEPQNVDVVTGEQSHVGVDAPEGLTRASVEVTVDRTSDEGLNFFALQVNFDNGTWAHGGLQDLDGEGDDRHLAVNWGGLVSRGGGSADYDGIGDEAEQARSLDLIQNPGDGKQLEDVEWSRGTTYVLTVERGDLQHFEPGDYVLTHGEDAVYVDHPRDLYAWTFTIRPAGGGPPIYEGTLYNSADTLDSFTYWNESGYGSTNDDLEATWSDPSYRTDAEPGRDVVPEGTSRY